MVFFTNDCIDMTIISRRILKIYKSLDKDQIQLVITKKIHGEFEIDHWLEKLHKLAVMDRLGDDTRIKSGDLSIVFGIFTAFTIFLTISKPFLFFFPVGFFLLFFYFLMMYITLNKIDIGNNLRMFIVPLLEHFKETKAVTGPVELKMDFSNPKKYKNLAGQINDKVVTDKLFRHHWMEGNLILDNQISIQWDITDIVKETGSYFGTSDNRADLKKKNMIVHKLGMKFRIPKNKFEIVKSDLNTIDADDYWIIQIYREDSSISIEEGMSPDIFLDAIKAGLEKIVKRGEFTS
jgi:hypothetical protein